MMDCTDRHDRFFLRLMSKNVMLYTEMVATKSAIHGDRKKILSFSPEEKPLALQIGGLLFAITFLSAASIIGVPSISFASIMLLTGAVLIFAVMVVAFELALAMRSHSVKEAGSLLGPAILFIIFPALFTQVINLDGIESWWFCIPLVNILLAMRELLLDRIIFEHILVWIISSVFYAALAAWFAARQFKREDLVASIS